MLCGNVSLATSVSSTADTTCSPFPASGDFASRSFGVLDLVIGCTLSVLIACILVGNSFVVLSVFLFRDMRTLTNWLIVSLASADLMVAAVVLPVALHYQLVGGWTLGPAVCDFWITADVFCCTASILNIVVIAIDRYWLITRNVRYTHSSRFSRKSSCVCMVLLAWFAACMISTSPLIGWQAGNIKGFNSGIVNISDIEGQCEISKDIVYTLFSTFGAFWFPLSVIVLVYHRIFNIARRRLRSRKRGHRNAITSMNSTALSEMNGCRRTSISISPPASQPLTYAPDETHAHRTHILVMTTPHDPRKPLAHGFNCEQIIVEKSSFWQRSGLNKAHFRELLRRSRCSQCCGSVSCCPRLFFPCQSASSSSTRDANKPRRRLRSSARTLGLIIGGFVVCWLPFFTIATVLPFCPRCEIPPYLTAISLWLGYSNSLLNPAIYAIWDKSFKRSFRRLLHCDVRWDNVFW